jgi:glycosyltransferase involved in cell wall biosynthesis
MRFRVGLDMHSFDGIHQGIKTHCLELFSRVVRLGAEIDFICFLDESDKLKEANSAFCLPNVTLVNMAKTSSPKRLLVQLPRLAKEHSLDLLHCQYICPPFSPCATAVTIHDTLFESHPQFFTPFFRMRSMVLMRVSAKKSALLCTVSDFSRKQLAQRYGIDEQKMCTLHNGVNRERFHPGNNGMERLSALGLRAQQYILTVGRLEPRKNHIGLVKAFSLLPQPRPKLAMVGQKDFQFTAVFDLIDDLKLQGEVVVLDNIDDDLLATVYRNASVFAYPSWAEGFGMPILEAMASGVPVITSGNTALSEVGGGAVVYADPSSPDSINSAIAKVLGDPILREVLVQKGLERAMLYEWDSAAEDLVRRYAQMNGCRNRSDTER